MNKREFSSASRDEIDVNLLVNEGSIPSDMYGYIYINSACGTVNSEGLPFKKFNPDGTENAEFGSPLINGDGMMIKLDMSIASKVSVKTGILRPPCYYADVATSAHASPASPYTDLAFKQTGLARISMTLGTRDELNTAITPVKFKKDGAHRLLATFDAGRPYEFDPKSLKLLTAIGENKIWNSGLPPFLFQPFAMILTTAHPVFDPETEELYTVNFTKDNKLLMSATHIFDILFNDIGWFKNKFHEFIESVKHLSLELQAQKAEKFLKELHLFHPKNNKNIFQKMWKWVLHKFDKWYYSHVTNPDAVKVLLWKGDKTLEEWTIVDENGKAIKISYNMHQIGFSKDYLVLCDTNFKFTLDVMVNFPFQDEPIIDSFIRLLLSGAMNDYSMLYTVKRSDLIPGVKQVKAVSTRLPVETVHFSVNYDNPNDEVTLHTAHNCSACPAEWLRTYDTLIASPTKKIDVQKVGLIAIGEMDIGKIGKCTVNAKTGELIASKTNFLHLTGEQNGALTGPHTWAVGLYTYNDILSPDRNVGEIKHIYWQSYGLSDDRLTHYVYNLYKSTERSRTYSAQEMLEFTKLGANFVLQCVDTDTMQVNDYYTFQKDQYFWSLQFAPKKNSTTGVPESKNGYIFTTVITGSKYSETELTYSCEIWIFDANNLKKGPVCKLSHPNLSFGFTIHSVWVATADAVSLPDYTLNVKEDYDYMVNQISDTALRARVQTLFDQEVYPHFN